MAIELLPKRQLLATIATRASSPLERLLQGASFTTDLSDINLQARLHRLYTLVGAGNDEAQARWLVLRGLDHAQLSIMLSSPHSQNDAPLSPWVQVLDRILTGFAVDHQCEESPVFRDRCLLVDAPVPFEDLLLPFVWYARQQLTLPTQELPVLLTYEAHVSLEHWLLMSLSQSAGQALLIEFSRFRAQREPHQEDWPERTGQQSGLYDAFVEQYRGENLLQFLQQYSTLAHLLVLQVEQWVDSCQEFLHRLAMDRADIALLFNGGQETGLVTEIIPGCSDDHHDGRSVFVLTFTPAFRLVYKPRCMDVDRAFFDLLSWVNAFEAMLPLQGSRVLSRASHGWMEYVSHAPCQTSQAVSRYYQRAGMLAGLCYIFGSTDIHSENLIASGEHPMVIDLETIISPGNCNLTSHTALAEPLPEKQDFVEYSVLRSALLPGLYIGHTSNEVKASALGPAVERQQPSLSWTYINTDAMAIQQKMVKNVENANAVILNGDQVDITDYGEEVITGFRIMYRFLLEHRDEFLSQNGPLARFAGCPIRFVFRATNIYYKLLLRLAHPRFLQDRADHWIEMQVFQRPLLRRNSSQTHWRIIEAELPPLERLDIPFFTTTTDSRDLVPDIGPKIEDVFVRSALEQVRSCVVALSEENMEQQVNLIRVSILSI